MEKLNNASVNPHDLFVMICLSMRFALQHRGLGSSVITLRCLFESYHGSLRESDRRKLLDEIGETRSQWMTYEAAVVNSWGAFAGEIANTLS